MKEMEAHKAKRLAARSEMINLAKVTFFFQHKALALDCSIRHFALKFMILLSQNSVFFCRL